VELILHELVYTKQLHMKSFLIVSIILFSIFFLWVPIVIGASVFGILAGILGLIVGLIGGIIGLIVGLITGIMKFIIQVLTWPFNWDMNYSWGISGKTLFIMIGILLFLAFISQSRQKISH
jgi:hypothetical protein